MKHLFEKLVRGSGPKAKAETPYPRTERFEYFSVPAYRHDIYEFSRSLTDYLEKNGIRNVLFVDRGARPAWVGVDEYWKEHYPEKPRPGAYFINPGVFSERARATVEASSMLTHMTDGLLPPILGGLAEETERAARKFIATYPELMKAKDEPLVLFDTCSHSGSTIIPLHVMLQAIGFSDVRVLTANEPNYVSPVQTDAELDKFAKLEVCYPFGNDTLIKKGRDIVSEPNQDGSREVGNMIRHEIREIIRRRGK